MWELFKDNSLVTGVLPDPQCLAPKIVLRQTQKSRLACVLNARHLGNIQTDVLNKKKKKKRDTH